MAAAHAEISALDTPVTVYAFTDLTRPESDAAAPTPVSYTHLDVYKRQDLAGRQLLKKVPFSCGPSATGTPSQDGAARQAPYKRFRRRRKRCV